MNYIAIAVLASHLVAGCQTSTKHGPTPNDRFDLNRAVQSNELEARWPPVENQSFQTTWLAHLQRTGRPSTSGLEDITSRTGPEMGQFCNADPNVRRELFRTTIARITEDGYAAYEKMYKYHCNMRVYATKRSTANLYVVVYGSEVIEKTRRAEYNDQVTRDTIVILQIPENVTTISGISDATRFAIVEYDSWDSM